MKVALAQINAVLGDFKTNAQFILTEIERAAKDGADLIVFPECALFGYHPVDLLDRPLIVRQQLKELQKITKACPAHLNVILGAITLNEQPQGKPYRNSAVLIHNKKIARIFNKELLPTYDVFDEGRHIQPGRTKDNIVRIGSHRVLITICEDIWAWKIKGKQTLYETNPLLNIKANKVDFVVNLSASPTTTNKLKWRHVVCSATARHFKAPMVYVNLVGGQDELIFDGGSLYINKAGKVIAQAKRFETDYLCIDLKETKNQFKKIKQLTQVESQRKAIVLGIQDFAKKTGFKKLHLGSSGGIDSALVACLAAEAVGPENLSTISMPGPFNSPDSAKWSKELSEQLDCSYLEMSIESSYKEVLRIFSEATGHSDFSQVNENLQARLRGLLLMAFSNQNNSLLLGTSNKSELAIGYSTLYGDLCGGLLPIGDLLKRDVYRLANHYHSTRGWIPAGILNRPPSAELRPNQTDQQSLPPYDVLDKAIEKLVDNKKSTQTKIDDWVLSAMMLSEFKRWQAPPILKVSEHAFGRGRRFPIAHRAKG